MNKGLHPTVIPIYLGLSVMAALPLNSYAQVPQPLTLIQAFPINGPEHLQPSGLASCDGQLLMVSDKHDHTVFALTTDDTHATAHEAISLNNIPEPPVIDLPWRQQLLRWGKNWFSSSGLDWEGITCDAEHVVLLSEDAVAPYRVNKAGEGVWLQTKMYDAAAQAGMLIKFNAFVEGIAKTQDGFMVAAERQPRGLITIVEEAETFHIPQVRIVESTGLPPVSTQVRADDFTGLYVENGKLFTLERNASAVCRRVIDTFHVEQCWSYAAVENADTYRYLDTRYGMAEGITVLEGSLYIVFDNSERFRYTDPTDNRSQLFKFELPANWHQ